MKQENKKEPYHTVINVTDYGDGSMCMEADMHAIGLVHVCRSNRKGGSRLYINNKMPRWLDVVNLVLLACDVEDDNGNKFQLRQKMKDVIGTSLHYVKGVHDKRAKVFRV